MKHHPRWTYICSILLVLLLQPLQRVVVSQQPSTTTATVLLTDISGSMDERDASGVIKLDAAKSAANAFLNAIQAEQQNLSGSRTDYLSQIAFCEEAIELQTFTVNVDAVRDAAGSLRTCGSTNMYDGFLATIQSLSQIRTTQSVDQNIVVMLSDGVPTASNSGSSNRSNLQNEVIDLIPQLASLEACLYIIPLGDPNVPADDERFVDLSFLQQLVDTVGCGELLSPSRSSDLVRQYISVRLRSIGSNILFDQTVNVLQNQTLSLPSFQVAANTEQLRLDAVWPRNDTVQFTILDPDGIEITEGYPNLSQTSRQGQTQLVLFGPKAGQYQTRISSLASTNSGSPIDLLISTAQNSSGAPMATITPVSNNTNVIFTVFLSLVSLGVVGAIIAYSVRNASNSTSTAVGGGSLLILSGMMSGQSVPIMTNPFIMGRNRGCHLQITEADISRQHAQILVQGDNYILQDLNSKSGLYVNGYRVSRHMLQHGDNVRIGTLNLRFQAQP